MRLLDITRLIRRAGRPMTGIDRVEYAYLRALSAGPEPFWAIARTGFGYVLLDQAGAQKIAQHLRSDDFGAVDALGYLVPRGLRAVRQAEADLRRLCHARCIPQRLTAMMQRHVPRGVRYINTGHANLTNRMLDALRSVDAHIAVMIHDVIPLEAPEWQRDGAADRFSQFLQRVHRHADLILYNSEDTKKRTECFLPHPKASIRAHLGVETADPEPLPASFAPTPPYFVCLGTIEPRKNHALLLDIWEEWGAEAPNLVLAGRRGWNNAHVLSRLDAGIVGITEAPNLTDGQVSALLDGANGLLFPSHLEGFGFPPMEAAMRRVPVIAHPLPALREVLGDIPIYVENTKPYLWRGEIEKLEEQRHRSKPFKHPTWNDHFNTVLRVT